MAHPPLPEPSSISVLTLTVSDTRTSADDQSGRLLIEALREAGFRQLQHELFPDEPQSLCTRITKAVDCEGVRAVILNGGTGIAPRDQTYEAVSSLIEKRLDGFGEAFRRLSWEQVGPRAMLSRAVAGTYHRGILFALPGSPRAVALGARELIVPILAHAISLL
jgi:molybdenum cofactor biosynthesis protein B